MPTSILSLPHELRQKILLEATEPELTKATPTYLIISALSGNHNELLFFRKIRLQLVVLYDVVKALKATSQE